MNVNVSVIIPTWNRPELVGGAIESVLAQTFPDFEIVVVDDGTKVRAESVVRAFSDERIRYIKHKHNKGCSAAKNTGVAHARGRFIAFLDDDDRWVPEKLAMQVKALRDAPPDVGFSFHAAIEVFNERKSITHVYAGVGEYLDFALRNFSGMIDSSMMYKREVFEAVGGLDESLPTHTGADFIIRVAQAFRGIGIDAPLVERVMESGHEHMGTNIGNRIKGREEILARYADEFAKRPRYLAKHLTQLARFYRQIGEYAQARRIFWRALRVQPSLARFAHALSMYANGAVYRAFRFCKQLLRL